jgi:hypothetical protein
MKVTKLRLVWERGLSLSALLYLETLPMTEEEMVIVGYDMA